MLDHMLDLIADSKRLIRAPEVLNDLMRTAEARGLIDKMPAFARDYHSQYPGLAELERNCLEVRRECEALVQKRERLVDVEQLGGKYTEGGIHAIAWKSLVLKSGRFLAENCRYAPRTAELLRGVDGLYTAFFSILDPQQYITPHWGYWKGFVRYHLPVVIPGNNADQACWLRVNADRSDNAARDLSLVHRGEKHYWKEGEGVMFDDTNLHDAKNGADAVRVVLWLDLRRRFPPLLSAANRALLDLLQLAPAVAAVRKNAIVTLDV